MANFHETTAEALIRRFSDSFTVTGRTQYLIKIGPKQSSKKIYFLD